MDSGQYNPCWSESNRTQENVMPATRRTDPQTSHDAARSISCASGSTPSVPARQQALLDLYSDLWNEVGVTGVDDTALVWNYEHRGMYPQQSPSGIRTRRKELYDLGLVVDTGRRYTLESGRKAIVWGLADANPF